MQCYDPHKVRYPESLVAVLSPQSRHDHNQPPKTHLQIKSQIFLLYSVVWMLMWTVHRLEQKIYTAVQFLNCAISWTWSFCRQKFWKKFELKQLGEDIDILQGSSMLEDHVVWAGICF